MRPLVREAAVVGSAAYCPILMVYRVQGSGFQGPLGTWNLGTCPQFTTPLSADYPPPTLSGGAEPGTSGTSATAPGEPRNPEPRNLGWWVPEPGGDRKRTRENQKYLTAGTLRPWRSVSLLSSAPRAPPPPPQAHPHGSRSAARKALGSNLPIGPTRIPACPNSDVSPLSTLQPQRSSHKKVLAKQKCAQVVRLRALRSA